MPGRIAIVGGSPTWRRGMGAVLADAGYEAVDVDDLTDWRPGHHGVAVVFAASTEGAEAAIAGFAGEYPAIPLVAVLPAVTPGTFAAAIRAGAASAAGEDDPTEVLVTVLSSALAGRVSADPTVIRALAARIPPDPDVGSWVSDDEAGWLRALAEGNTVARLAEDIGYSERETFRMLGDLYTRLGVRNRTEAIIWATRHGVIRADFDGPRSG